MTSRSFLCHHETAKFALKVGGSIFYVEARWMWGTFRAAISVWSYLE